VHYLWTIQQTALKNRIHRGDVFWKLMYKIPACGSISFSMRIYLLSTCNRRIKIEQNKLIATPCQPRFRNPRFYVTWFVLHFYPVFPTAVLSMHIRISVSAAEDRHLLHWIASEACLLACRAPLPWLFLSHLFLLVFCFSYYLLFRVGEGNGNLGYEC
jgi:hypothetical protein